MNTKNEYTALQGGTTATHENRILFGYAVAAPTPLFFPPGPPEW